MFSSFIDFKNILYGDGGGCYVLVCVGQGVYGKSPCLSPSFAVNLKLLSKIKPTEKYKELYICILSCPLKLHKTQVGAEYAFEKKSNVTLNLGFL